MESPKKDTLIFYEVHAKDFFSSTVDVEFSDIQDRFLTLLPDHASVLDFGCGSGRDTKYFLEKGYVVSATDGAEELCQLASEYTGISVRHEYFEQLDEEEVYDGIWACSSILHVKKNELPDILRRMARAIKDNGIIYTSFKYGDFEGERNGRYFSDFTEESFARLLEQIPCLKVQDLFITGDVRLGRGEERWLNLILRKRNIH
ncbi:MAG: class I SAM-dependent methyltransferase [Eubacteriales bacterium]|nr:class I SAM-dependent methyltransferase [Eubacteriales bacterium]